MKRDAWRELKRNWKRNDCIKSGKTLKRVREEGRFWKEWNRIRETGYFCDEWDGIVSTCRRVVRETREAEVMKCEALWDKHTATQRMQKTRKKKVADEMWWKELWWVAKSIKLSEYYLLCNYIYKRPLSLMHKTRQWPWRYMDTMDDKWYYGILWLWV
jgi:hypothetical protein